MIWPFTPKSRTTFSSLPAVSSSTSSVSSGSSASGGSARYSSEGSSYPSAYARNDRLAQAPSDDPGRVSGAASADWVGGWSHTSEQARPASACGGRSNFGSLGGGG